MREHLADLVQTDLAPDEAFLIAARRTDTLDEALASLDRSVQSEPGDQTGTVPAELSGGLRQKPESAPAMPSGEARREFVVVGALSCAAAVAIKAPEIFGVHLEHDADFYARNISLLVLPFLAGYFAWKHRLGRRTLALAAAAFAVPAVVLSSYPFEGGSDPSATEIQAALHLPVLLWLVVGLAHAGGDWRSHPKRMDFVRFTGEWVNYFGLIALGGGLLTGTTTGIFSAIGIDVGEFVGLWVLPCGGAGAVVVAGWLAESRQGVLERIAPVLTRLFTPLFTLLLVIFLLAMALTGRGIDLDRGVLIVFYVLLALVLALVIHSVSARDPSAPRGVFDLLQLLLVVAALLVDLLVLGAVAGRLSDFGATPNRIAAVGVSFVLMVNFAWSAWLHLGYWRGRRSFAAIARWQTAYAPVYAIWPAVVVVALPPVFGFA